MFHTSGENLHIVSMWAGPRVQSTCVAQRAVLRGPACLTAQTLESIVLGSNPVLLRTNYVTSGACLNH